MAGNKLKAVSDTSFETDVLRSDVLVVIDFWAPWCEPCKLVAPILESLAGRYGDTVRFFTMNVDEAKKPAEFGVRSIPTLLFFKDGTIKNQLVGVHSEEKVAQVIKTLL